MSSLIFVPVSEKLCSSEPSFLSSRVSFSPALALMKVGWKYLSSSSTSTLPFLATTVPCLFTVPLRPGTDGVETESPEPLDESPPLLEQPATNRQADRLMRAIARRIGHLLVGRGRLPPASAG